MARPRRTSAASDLSSVPDQRQELSSMYDYLAKVVLLGPSGAGKSCLLHRFINQEWRVLSSQTIGVEFSSKIVKVGGGSASGQRAKRIKLQLWDTAGTERFRSVSRSYYRGAAGAVLVYDVASLASFHALPTFLSDARALASPHLTVVLAGNKADLADAEAAASSQPASRTQGVHMNGSAHAQRTQRDRDRERDQYRDDEASTPAASSASSRRSYFPYDSGGGGGGSESLKSTTSTATPAPTATTRSRGDSVNVLASQKWTATLSPDGREVTSHAASVWASKALIPYTAEVSALTGENVDTLFYRLAAMILTKIELGEIDPDDPSSGIQYGDGGDVESITTDGGTVRRRKGGTVRRGVLPNLGEWEDVFRRPASRGGRCC